MAKDHGSSVKNDKQYLVVTGNEDGAHHVISEVKPPRGCPSA